jgi:hypothetical protein
MTGNSEAPTIELAPTPKEIDKRIAEYSAAAAEAAALYEVADKSGAAALVFKAGLTALVEKWGGRHTEKSKRLQGLHHKATTTTGTLVSIDAAAVEKLRVYLGTTETPELAGEFFTAHTSYNLVKGPDKKLESLTMGARLRTKIKAMLKGCFEIKTKTASLTIEMAELKPAA